MPCEIRGNMIICNPARVERCDFCGGRSIAFCDFPNGRGTCDAKMCGHHRKSVGPNKDFCPKHATPLSHSS